MIRISIPNPSKIFNDYIYKSIGNYTKRLEVWYGGASSGKSEGVYQKVILKSLKEWKYPRKVLVLRKVNASIRESSWEHVKDVLTNFKLIDHCYVNKTEQRIVLPNGATLLFKGLDDPEKIKSIKGISDIVLEEATEFTLEDFDQLNLRLRDRKHQFKQMFLMFNPVSKRNWVYKYFFVEKTGEPKDFDDTLFTHSTYHDNKFLDDVTKEQLEKLRTRNPAYYKIYAQGLFATLDKLVFNNVTTRIISEKEVNGLTQYHGMDFGYINDPSAILIVKYNPETETVYILREYVKSGMLNNEIAQTIKDLGISREIIFADSEDRKSIDEIKLLEVPRIKPVQKGQGSVIHGIQWLNQKEIVIDERCFKTIEEFENYTWKKDKKTGEYYNEPVDTYNHCIDALRYALSELILAKMGVTLYDSSILG